MADEIETPPAERDFADMAVASMQEDAPAETKAPKTEKPKQEAEPTSRKSTIPAELMGAKKEETAPVEDELETSKIPKPEFKDPKRAAQWDALHGKASEFEKKYRDAEKKAAELEKRIADGESKGKNTEELQAKLADMEKKTEEYEKLVRQSNLENDPKFRAKYIEGRASKVSEIEQIISDAGGDPKDVSAALALKGKARVDSLRLISDDLPGYLQGLLGTAIRELDTLDREAATERADAGKYFEERQRETVRERQRAEQEAIKEEEMGWERATRKARTDFEVLNKVEGNDEWNAKVDKIELEARRSYESSHSAEQKAQLILEAHAGRVYKEALISERAYADKLEKENAEQKKELTKLYGSKPDLGGRASSASSSGGSKDFADRTIETMSGVGA